MGRKQLLIMTLLAFGGFFSGGCNQAQRAALLTEVKEWAGEQISAQKESMIVYVDTKIADMESKKLIALDVQLAPLAAVDPDTGVAVTKSWKDFDANKDGSLDLVEQGRVAVYVAKRTSAKVSSGEMTADDAKKTAKGVGGTLAALALIYLGKKGVDKVRGKKVVPPVVPPKE